MSTYSVAEAKAKLSALIDEALEGKPVTITRHGQAVVEVRAAAREKRRMTQADIDWLVKRRVGRKPAKVDAAALLSKMRDEDWK
jgi:prevent-host-death family protein